MADINQESELFAGLMPIEKFKRDMGDPSERTIARYRDQGLRVIRRGNLRFIEIEQAQRWIRGEHVETRRPRGRPHVAA